MPNAKRWFLSLALVLFAGMSFSQVNSAEMSIDKDIHDYGTISKGDNGDCYFTITNTGDSPLIISNARGSCNCTVPSWPKEPIAPGKSAKMKVTYGTDRVGPINKSVTITSNSANTPTKVVRIRGTVKAHPSMEKVKVGPKAK